MLAKNVSRIKYPFLWISYKTYFHSTDAFLKTKDDVSVCHKCTGCNCFFFFFSIWVFFHDHSRITGLQGKGEGIFSLTPHYHFHPLHRQLEISRAITAGSSPLHIASSRTRTGNLWFPSASRLPLSYAPLNWSWDKRRKLMI